ncbi:MAG: glycine zipper family protein [Comamonadaceae bacterium]|nr:glycine zipper family protein [Comamonadaceae bacterium]
MFSIALAIPAFAGELIIFPAKGQSAKTMEKDKTNCQTWAKKETGVDPLVLAQKSAEQAPPAGPQGERVRGAAKGAAAGAVVGAVAGDAGKGAAIGATAGVMAGGARQRGKAKAEQGAQQQQQAQTKQALDKYNRAYTACLEGKGYTVK